MKNLFVGNMSFQTTESELTALFQRFGQVTRVHIGMDRGLAEPAALLSWKCPMMTRRPRRSLASMGKSSVAASLR